MSETLRLGQEGVTTDTPLFQDYLKLFSTIIPDNVVSPHLDRVTDGILTSHKLLDDPDRAQRELESIVLMYLHPKGLEKLINFYILRNERVSTILITFHELWKLGIDDPKLLTRYASYFKQHPRLEDPRFELAIIEKYLTLKPSDRMVIKEQLAATYARYGNSKMALNCYLQLIDEVKEKVELISRVLDICIKEKSYEDATILFEKYSDIIRSEKILQLKTLELLSATDRLDELTELLLDHTNQVELMQKNPILYRRIMDQVGMIEEARKGVRNKLQDILETDFSISNLIEIGVLFEVFDISNEFKDNISRLVGGEAFREILRRIESRAHELIEDQ